MPHPTPRSAPRPILRSGRSRLGFTLVEIMIVVLIIGTLMAIAVPNFVRARNTSRSNACLKNLRMIDGAKDQWAMDNRKNNGDPVLQTDLMPAVGNGYLQAWPACPANGTYTINVVGTNPTCSLGGAHCIP